MLLLYHYYFNIIITVCLCYELLRYASLAISVIVVCEIRIYDCKWSIVWVIVLCFDICDVIYIIFIIYVIIYCIFIYVLRVFI